MRIIKLAVASILLSISLTSCFKDEPENTECDIEQAYITTDDYKTMFFYASDAQVDVPSDDKDIHFTVRSSADLTAIAPQFKLTEGATISPENGSVHDFSDPSNPVEYTVTSENGKWSRTYKVYFDVLQEIEGAKVCDFSNYKLSNDSKYFVWYDKVDGKELRNWATGNPGFKISNGSANWDEYPTVPTSDGEEHKNCVKLTTRRTSSLADMVKMPIAAGNLFIGTFDASNALKDAMKATHFGLPFSFKTKPIYFSGYYKYLPGEKFTNRSMKEIKDRVDEGTIYAVLYDNHDKNGKAVVLHGDDVQTSPQIVAIAILPNIGKTEEWTYFNIPFNYKKNIDAEKLANGGYSLAVVCSSSVDGAIFQGAIGSTLWVDKIIVKCEDAN